MSPDVVARAKAALEGVTRGPWKWDGDSFEDVLPTVCPHGGRWEDHGPDLVIDGIDPDRYTPGTCVITSSGYDASNLNINTADAEFIAAARSLVPELVAEVESLRAALDRVRELATSYTPSPDLVEAIVEELDR